MRKRLALACVACLGAVAKPVAAGALQAPLAPRSTWPAGLPTPAPADSAPHPGGQFLRSLVLPGWGQWKRGERRAWAYAGIEVVALAAYADARLDAGRLRDDYRDLAWEVARMRPEPRVDGDFPYYEALSNFLRSGAFDTDAGSPGVQPEADPSTFNGRIWALARGLFFPPGGEPDPGSEAFRKALAYYEERAVRDGFEWSWVGAESELERYRTLIRRSDDRSGDARLLLGLVIGNHVVSAFDAFLSARTGARVGAFAVPEPGRPGRVRVRVGMRLRVP